MKNKLIAADKKALISKKLKVIYFPVQRAGTTTVRMALHIYINPRLNKYDFSVTSYKRICQDTHNGYFIFTFVRNPWDRLVSAYEYCKRKRWEPAIKNNFKSFIKEAISPTHNTNCHWCSQLQLVPINRLNFNLIGKIEAIERDFKIISKTLGIEMICTKAHQSKRNPDYTTYYDEETIGMVVEHYKQDIDIFNYKFGEQK
jgi:hypothetical protein